MKRSEFGVSGQLPCTQKWGKEAGGRGDSDICQLASQDRLEDVLIHRFSTSARGGFT